MLNLLKKICSSIYGFIFLRGYLEHEQQEGDKIDDKNKNI